MSSVASNVIRPWNKRAPLVWNALASKKQKSHLQAVVCTAKNTLSSAMSAPGWSQPSAKYPRTPSSASSCM